VKPDEFLESTFKDSFKRELEVDENVARTLPFFAATLALAATLFRYVLPQLPKLTLSWISLTLHGLLVAGGVCLAVILWTLFQAVRVREYRIPPRETELATWQEELRAYYRGLKLTPATVETRVLADLRSRMILEYAEAAEHNRAANAPKVAARAFGFTMLVVMLSIAFLMIGIMFVVQRVSQPPPSGAPRVAACQTIAAPPGPVACDAAGAAARAAAPGAAGRGEVSGRAGGQHRGDKVNDEAKTPLPPAPPAQSAAPPPAPIHQLLKKNEEAGGPIGR
jgi:hypothetical protein